MLQGIIYVLCEFLSLQPTAYHRLLPMEIAKDSESSCSFCTDWKAIGRPMHGAGLGAIGRVVVAVRFENGVQWVSRCSAGRSSGWPKATAVRPFTKIHSVL